MNKKAQVLPEPSSNFVDHICSLLARDQSLPCVTLSTSLVNISDTDFEKNLSQFIEILNQQYIKKQDNVRKELENKQKYLHDFQQTQLNDSKELNEKFERIQKRYSTLKEQYQQVRLFSLFKSSIHTYDFIKNHRNVPVENVLHQILMILYQ